MTRHTKLNTRILSAILSVALIGTVSQATIHAAESSDASMDVGSIVTIRSFDGLELPFLAVEDSENTYSLTVKAGTTLADLNLPDRLTATVQRTTAVTQPEEDEEIKDSGAVEDFTVDTSPPDGAAEIVQEEFPSILLLEATQELPPAARTEEEEANTAAETIPVTWDSDPSYDPEADTGSWIFTARIPESYTLGAGVPLPEIYVMTGAAVMLADGTYDIADAPIDITGAGTYTITGKSSENTILVSAASGNIDITLNDVKIENGNAAPFTIVYGSWANVTITLQGNNVLNSTGNSDAGIQKNGSTGSLTITGNGSLIATGFQGAGIGASYTGSTDNITINGNAKVTARSIGTGAGIGGGYGGIGSNITIDGNAVVNAYGGQGLSNGAGIGGGNMGGDGSNILITGNAVVNAIGGNRASGIGGGYGGDGNNIVINGNALVHATGGIWSAGIGGGNANSDAGGGSGIGNSVSGNAVVFATGGLSGDHVQGMTQTGGILFQGTDGIMLGNVTLNQNVDIPTGHTITVPFGNTLTNEAVLSVHGVLEYGGINGELVNNGTLNLRPASTTLTVNKNGQPVTEVTYGDTVTLEMAVQASATKARAANANTMDYYIDDGNGNKLIGNSSASFVNGVATSSLSVYVGGAIWSAGGNPKKLSAEYGGTSMGGTGMLGDTALSSLIVNPAILTVANLTAEDRKYDGTNAVSLSGGVLSGVVAGETVDMPTSGIIPDANVGTGKTVIPRLVPGRQNYTLLPPPGLTVNITHADPVVTFANLKEILPYTGATAVVTPPQVTLLNNDQYVFVFFYSFRPWGGGVYQGGLPTDAGTYLVRAETTPVGNYAAATSTNELVLTIELAAPTVTFSAPQETLAYTGVAAIVTAPDVTLLNGGQYSGEVLYSFQPSAGAAYQSGLPTDAGTYLVSAQTAPDGNHAAATSTNELELTIKLAAPTVTFSALQETLTYTGVAAIVTAPDVTLLNGQQYSGAVLYSFQPSAGAAYLSGLPTEVGTYQIRARVAADGNYTAADSTNELRLTITSFIPALIINSYADAVYTGRAAADPTDITSNVPNPTLTYTWYSDSGGVKEDKLPGAPKDAGAYHVEGSIAANGSAASVTSDAVRFNIRKAAAPIAEEGSLSVYNNEAAHHSFELGKLLTPDLQFGEEAYEIKAATTNSYYAPPTDSDINDGILDISIKAVNSSVEGIVGTINVTVKSQNYADMDALLTVSAVNKFTPPATGGSSGGGGSGGGGGNTGNTGNSEHTFWMGIKDKIIAAKSGDVVKINARAYDKIPVSVINALRKNSGVTLVISRQAGKAITIPAGKAPRPQAGRIYYPLSLLEVLYKEPTLAQMPIEPGKQGLEAGVPGYIQHPDDKQIPLTAGRIVMVDATEALPTAPNAAKTLSAMRAGIAPPDRALGKTHLRALPMQRTWQARMAYSLRKSQ